MRQSMHLITHGKLLQRFAEQYNSNSFIIFCDYYTDLFNLVSVMTLTDWILQWYYNNFTANIKKGKLKLNLKFKMLFPVICNSRSITRRESPPVGIEPNAFGRLDESSESRMSLDETGWAVDQTDQLFAVWYFVRESVQRRQVRPRSSVRREFANRFQLTTNQLYCTVD